VEKVPSGSLFKWFIGGRANIPYNCLDRHLDTARKNRVAILPEGPGDVRALTYQVLHREVCKFANVLKSWDCGRDRATIYMGWCGACGHDAGLCPDWGDANVVFSGFSAKPCGSYWRFTSRVLITADGGFRRGTTVALKKNADDALHGRRRLSG
jgi:acetyl-CoA synthetase